MQHCPTIGPVRLALLREVGVRSWPDVLAFADRLPKSFRQRLFEESCRCLAALECGDIRFFVDRFASQDQWRILTHFIDSVSFFDIETMGLEYDAPITTIACWHDGRLLTFVEHENLDEFLALLDEVKLLASFNGSSFDVPRVLDAFHIPQLPCPHVDLRWSCYHKGLRGGLKKIATQLGIVRPVDLQDADGAIAAHLWNRWTLHNDRTARDRLLRYCSSDVLLSVMIAKHLAGQALASQTSLWEHLPADTISPETTHWDVVAPVPSAEANQAGGPSRLRALRKIAS